MSAQGRRTPPGNKKARAKRKSRSLSTRGDISRRRGVKRFKWEAHTLVGRRGRRLVTRRPWLGPAQQLGDDVVVEILPSANFRLLVQNSNAQQIRKDLPRLIQLINSKIKFSWLGLWRALYNLYDRTYSYMMPLIGHPQGGNEGYAPRDTGSLRRSMRNSLGEPISTIVHDVRDVVNALSSGAPFIRMVLSTPDIDYANPVNNMPTSWLAHPGSHPPGTRGRLGTVLHDPNARKGWYNLILLRGRQFAKKEFYQMLKNLAQGIRGGYNFWRSMFTVRFK